MTNDVKIFGGHAALVDSATLLKNLETSASLDPRAGQEGSVFVNFSGKNGTWQVGPDKDDMDPEEAWLINIHAFEDGIVCWKNNQNLATRMVPAGSPVPSIPVDNLTLVQPLHVQARVMLPARYW